MGLPGYAWVYVGIYRYVWVCVGMCGGLCFCFAPLALLTEFSKGGSIRGSYMVLMHIGSLHLHDFVTTRLGEPL